MNKVFGRLNFLTKWANFYIKRMKVIEGNIANADTPFYKPKDIVFERELEKTIPLKREHPKHIDPSSKVVLKEKELEDVIGYDQNKVNLDKELGKLAETAIMVRSINEIIRKELGKLKLVIQGRQS